MEVMAAWRRAIELSLGDEDTAKLNSTAQSRTEPASRVERARILLAYREDPSFFAQAIATTAPDLPPEPGVHATFAREFEYERHGTVTHHGRNGLLQSRARRSHLDLQTRQGSLI